MVAPLVRRYGRKSSQVRKIVLSCENENCCRRNVRKHREIKGGERYFTLDISLKFDSLENMKITSSESKDNLGISGKCLINSLGLKAIVRPHI